MRRRSYFAALTLMLVFSVVATAEAGKKDGYDYPETATVDQQPAQRAQRGPLPACLGHREVVVLGAQRPEAVRRP